MDKGCFRKVTHSRLASDRRNKIRADQTQYMVSEEVTRRSRGNRPVQGSGTQPLAREPKGGRHAG